MSCQDSFFNSGSQDADSWYVAFAAVPKQNGRPVAFLPRTMRTIEHHSPVEKGTYPIVKAIQDWRYYLLGVHSQLRIGGQLFPCTTHIRNDKIQRRRNDLSCDIYSRRENSSGHAFSAILCPYILHVSERLAWIPMSPWDSLLCHLRSRNFASLIEDVRKTASTCFVCAELKLRFCKTNWKLDKNHVPWMLILGNHCLYLSASNISQRSRNLPNCHSRFLVEVWRRPQLLTYSANCPSSSECLYASTWTVDPHLCLKNRHFLHAEGIVISRPTDLKSNGQMKRLNGAIEC